jgi:DNA replication protein DnaC
MTEDEQLREAQRLLEAKRAALPSNGSNGPVKLNGQLLSAPLVASNERARKVSVRCKCGTSFDVPQVIAQAAVAPECPACVEAERQADERARIERKASERMAKRRWLEENIKQVLTNSGVLTEHSDAQLEDFPADVRAAAAALIHEPRRYRGILITGSPGRGKTHLLAAIGRSALLTDHKFYFAMARALLRRLWSTFRDDARESEEEVIRELTSVPFLLIDDLSHEGRISEAGVGAFHEILSVRNGNFLPTVISTNLTLVEIGRAYDEAIKSRLAAWLPIVLTGRDRRLDCD